MDRVSVPIIKEKQKDLYGDIIVSESGLDTTSISDLTDAGFGTEVNDIKKIVWSSLVLKSTEEMVYTQCLQAIVVVY